jgi:hypothetical protein
VALADHLLRRGRLDEARQLAERIVALHPEQEVGHRLLAAIAGSPPRDG